MFFKTGPCIDPWPLPQISRCVQCVLFQTSVRSSWQWMFQTASGDSTKSTWLTHSSMIDRSTEGRRLKVTNTRLVKLNPSGNSLKDCPFCCSQPLTFCCLCYVRICLVRINIQTYNTATSKLVLHSKERNRDSDNFVMWEKFCIDCLFLPWGSHLPLFYLLRYSVCEFPDTPHWTNHGTHSHQAAWDPSLVRDRGEPVGHPGPYRGRYRPHGAEEPGASDPCHATLRTKVPRFTESHNETEWDDRRSR